MKWQISLHNKMGKLINAQPIMPEGKLLNQYFKSRLINQNKNVLIAVTGPTGSGKSYACQRIAELWYKEYFNKEFPTETNTCFSIKEVMERLTDKNNPLKRGELLIVEEAGTQLGNLDFQNKVSKIFTYVLQSFRSMNIGLIFNLPVLSMLNKSARLLIHAHFTTTGIDQDNKTSNLKPKFHQLNQDTGKIYPKFLRVAINGKIIPVKRFSYGLPTGNLLKIYEQKKFRFVSELNEGFLKDLEQMRSKGDKNNILKYPEPIKWRAFNLERDEGLNQEEIGNRLGKAQNTISRYIKEVKNWIEWDKRRQNT
jgi:energy-coupling factor transporter ATP-binding protein EcfA2